MPHQLIVAFIGLASAFLIAVVVRIVIGNPKAARHRVRVLRWRTRLYLRPGPGYANMVELIARWSRLRAIWIGGRSRPSLPWWSRLFLPVTAYAVRLGRAHLGRRVIASMEDQILVLAAPRTGKSGWLADRIIDHPGAVMATTTRTDLFDNTRLLRARHGDLHVFNPEGIGGVPSTFRWNPLQGCENPAVALQRASTFTGATESQRQDEMRFWLGKATSALACLLHAAALDSLTMIDVYQWAHGINAAVAEEILATHPGAADGWLGPVMEIRRPGKTADSVRMTVTRALSWLADPAVAEATTPGPGEGFDVAEFVTGANTLYLIGSGREDAPIAPLFRAFAEYVHAGAAYIGSFQPRGRLAVPLLFALDEVTQICPVPLPLWMADSAGKGILIVAICHGLAQLEARWGHAGARSIWDTAGIKVILGGVTDADTLDRLSRICGDVELRTRSRTWDQHGRRARTITYQPARVLPPELLRTLPDWRALVVRANLSPVIIKLRTAWRRHDYRRARRTSRASLPRRSAMVGGDPLAPRPLPSVHISPPLDVRAPRLIGQVDHEPTTQDQPAADAGTGSASRWPRPQDWDDPPMPLQGATPRSRRPWEPPLSAGNHS